MEFSVILIFSSIILLVTAYFLWHFFSNNTTLWRKIPREKNFGIILGFCSLAWSAYHLHATFVSLRPFLFFLVIGGTVLCYYFLDYLFTRGLGGICVLAAEWLLHEAFIAHTPLRPLFAGICYILGITGLFFIATPYRLRDLLEKATESSVWRASISLFIAVIGVIFGIIGIRFYV